MLSCTINVKNEAAIIDHWMLHHVNMFDALYVLDYDSTDDTVDRILKHRPDAHIVEPQFVWGPAVEDIERIESTLRGWKIALNVTEFVVNPDLRPFCKELDRTDWTGIRSSGFVLIDDPATEFDANKSIIEQCTRGYAEHDWLFEAASRTDAYTVTLRSNMLLGLDGRSRLLHKNMQGCYGQGRHRTALTTIWPRSTGTCPESEFVIAWAGWAPARIRKQRRLIHANRQLDGLACTDAAVWRSLAEQSYDLRRSTLYNRIWSERYNSHII